MKIFLSHSGRDKCLVREIVKLLPDKIKTWLDENDLPLGVEITKGLKETIENDTDLIILFVSPEAINSHWVQKELQWAINREKQLGYTFIFPIVLDKGAWEKIKPDNFRDRKHLLLNSFEKSDVESLSKKLNEEIFNWLIRFHEKGRYTSNRIVLNMKSANLFPARELYNKPELPEDQKAAVRFKENNKTERDLNNKKFGIPVIIVEVINNGSNDVQIEDLQMVFNEFTEEDHFDSEIKKVTALSLSSLSYGNNVVPSDFILKANHKKEFPLSAKIFIKIVLERGIKAIVATDVIGNKYEVPVEKIEEEIKYLKLFFKSHGLETLYNCN